jgi:hypothetical protein
VTAETLYHSRKLVADVLQPLWGATHLPAAAPKAVLAQSKAKRYDRRVPEKHVDRLFMAGLALLTLSVFLAPFISLAALVVVMAIGFLSMTTALCFLAYGKH